MLIFKSRKASHTHEEQAIQSTQPENIIKLAVIVDNEVKDIMHAQEDFIKVFLQNPTFIECTENSGAKIGAIYDPESGAFFTKGSDAQI